MLCRPVLLILVRLGPLLAYKFAIGAETYNRKSAANWQTLDEKFQSFLRNLHSTSRHRAATVNQENEAKLLSFGQLYFVGSFLRDDKILGLHRLESRNKTGHASILIRMRIELVFQLGCKHVVGLEKYPDFTFGNL